MKVSHVSFLALILGALVTLAPNSRGQDSPDAKDASKPDRPAAGQRERRGGPGGGGAAQIERISERLKLTDEQKTKLQPILREEAAKLRELRQDNSLSREQMRDKAREVREQYLAKMKPILSEEQLDQFKKMRQEGAARGPRGSRQGGDARTPADPAKK
jgi:Spy/CpxP family protein refolding chaperone